jgi:HK97 gp10 family phage protein
VRAEVVTLKSWKGDEARKRIAAEMTRRLYAAGLLVERHAKRLLSVAGTGTKASGRGRVYGANPSAPGEPPHKQTGRLRASVASEVDAAAQTARVGTNVKYGKYLELGTRRMKPRPWLRRSLSEVRDKIRAIFARPLNLD